MVFEYWTFGNADAVLQLLNAVAAVTANSSGFVGAAKTLGLFGFLVMVIAALMKADPRGMIGWFLGLVLGWYILFVPKVDLAIQDNSAGGSASVRTVGNVPLGLGFIASSSSKMGRWLTEIAETTFSLPDQTNFINGGFLAPHRMSVASLGYTLQNERLASDWMNFMRDCTWYDINVYSKRFGYTWALSSDEYQNTPNPLESLGKTNKALFVHIVTGGAGVHACNDAYEILKTATEAEAVSSHIQRRYAKAAFPGLTEAEAVSTFQATLSDAQLVLYGAPIATHQLIQNRWIHNLMRAAPTRNAISSGNTALAMVEFGAIQAEQARLNSYVQSARAAHDTIPAIRNILEAVIIGLFPVVLLLTILLGFQGLRLFLEYATALLSLQLWGFCYALLNYFLISKTASNVYGIANSNGAGDISLSTLGMVAEEITADMAMAGSMTWAIPIICFGLCRGSLSMGLSTMASRAAATSQSSAEKSGGEIGSGNMRSGEGRFGMVNAPNTISMGGAAGAGTYHMGNSGGQLANAPMQAFQGYTTVGFNTQQAAQMALSTGAISAQRASNTLSMAASEQRTAAQAQMVSAALKRSDASSVDQAWQTQGQGSFTRGVEATRSIVDGIQSATGANQQVATDLAMSAGMGTGSFSPLKLNAEIGKSYGAAASAKFEASSASKDQQAYKDASQFVQTMTASQSARHSVMGGSEQAKGVDARLSDAKTMESGARAAHEESQALQQQSQQVASGQSSVSLDLSRASPEVAQKISSLAQHPTFREAMASGNVQGAMDFMANRLSEGLYGSRQNMDSLLKGISVRPGAAPSLESGPTGGPAPTADSIKGDYAQSSAQIQSSGTAAVNDQWQGRPQVNTSRPDTSSVQKAAGSGMATAQRQVNDGQQLVDGQVGNHKSSVSPHLPVVGNSGELQVTQSQVQSVGRNAIVDAANTVHGQQAAVEAFVKKMTGNEPPPQSNNDSMAYVNKLRAENGQPPLAPPTRPLTRR